MDSRESGAKGGKSELGKTPRAPFIERNLVNDMRAGCCPGSLLDRCIRLTVPDVLDHLDSRKNKVGPGATLPPAATLELFAGTRGRLTEDDIKDILPELDPQHVRRETKARGRKMDDLRRFALALLRSRQMDNAQVVGGWVLVLVYAAVMEVLRNATPKERNAVRQAMLETHPSAEMVISAVHDVLRERSLALLNDANDRLKDGYGQARSDVFIHFSACTLLAVMTRPERAEDTQRLVIEFYADINAFGDPEES